MVYIYSILGWEGVGFIVSVCKIWLDIARELSFDQKLFTVRQRCRLLKELVRRLTCQNVEFHFQVLITGRTIISAVIIEYGKW